MNNEITAKIDAATNTAQELIKAIRDLQQAACSAGGDNENREAILLAELVQREIAPAVNILGNLTLLENLYTKQ